MKRTFFISGTKVLPALKSVFEVVIKLGYFFKSTSQRRYIQLTPSVCSTQRLYDRKTGEVLRIYIRNFVDFSTLSQVYLVEDYAINRLRRHDEIYARFRVIKDSGRVPLIIDCGGNIGLASRYFSENFPGADIICIEPDAANLEQARLNNNSRHVTFVQAAVGCKRGHGVITNPEKWNNAFRIERREQGGVDILTIDDILALYDRRSHEPFLIKIDIEGFESELFSTNLEWINLFPILTVELHDWMLPKSASSGNFLRAISPLGRDFILQRENVWSISNR
jgi:FkbM family methyltransferase